MPDSAAYSSTASALERFMAVWGRLILTGLALVVQIAAFIVILQRSQAASPWVGVISFIISLVVLAFIMNSRMHMEYKLSWAILIVLFPLVGGVAYLLFGSRTGTGKQLAAYYKRQYEARHAQLGSPGMIEIPGVTDAYFLFTTEEPGLKRVPGGRWGQGRHSALHEAADSAQPASKALASATTDDEATVVLDSGEQHRALMASSAETAPADGPAPGAVPAPGLAESDPAAPADPASDVDPGPASASVDPAADPVSAAAPAAPAADADLPAPLTVNLPPAEISCEYLESLPAEMRQQMTFLASMGPFVPYREAHTTYYPLGEDAFPDMLAALESAEKWIGFEYFIISDGYMWQQIADVLKRKAAEGVEVRLMYDDIGSIWELPHNFVRDLTDAGIRVKPVNKFGPGVMQTLRYNNRDHRKIMVVDGAIAFTGGINIADEYINHIEKYGHWRDTVLRIQGPGAWGLANLFLTLWDLLNGESTDMDAYRPSPERLADMPTGEGVVVSYDDTPLDDFSLGWAAYRNAMGKARSTVDICTPYLIISQDMVNTIASLALSGVRVRVVTPGVPDKRMVWQVTKSNYRPLVESGVEVYEYTPGFVHAKQMIVDSDMAIIGTVNFDFRSFYLHQENAVWMYETSAVEDMSRDFDALVAVSRRITLREVRSTPWWRRGYWLALRTFAPLM